MNSKSFIYDWQIRRLIHSISQYLTENAVQGDPMKATGYIKTEVFEHVYKQHLQHRDWAAGR
jgi:hypothetical protein